MRAAIISDLHLESADDPKLALFEQSARTIATQADRLLILGDLFERWVGDDDPSPLATRVAASLRGLADAGIEIGFQRGNRDFLIGDDYARRCGMRLLPEIAVITIGAIPVLVLHGDSLCTDDLAYQAVRSQFRDPDWQRAFLKRPLAERRVFAEQARAASRAHMAGAKDSIGDIVPDEAIKLFRAYRVATILHGHTHRPAIHHDVIDEMPVRRIVTADWREDFAEVLWLDADAQRSLKVTRDVITPR